MNRKVVLKAVREILDEAFIGLTMPTEKPRKKQENLEEEAYEKIPVVYYPRPLKDKSNHQKYLK